MIESFKPKLQFSLFNVLLVFFICWTIFMGVTTWNIQHSCQPMIGQLDISISNQCIPEPIPSPRPTPTPSPTPSPRPTPTPSPTPSPRPTPTPSPRPSPRPTPTPSPRPTPPPPPPIHDVLGVAAGGAAITGLAIVEAPVLAVVAAGIGIWFLVRTTIKLINGS
jgi:hypothetical protein